MGEGARRKASREPCSSERKAEAAKGWYGEPLADTIVLARRGAKASSLTRPYFCAEWAMSVSLFQLRRGSGPNRRQLDRERVARRLVTRPTILSSVGSGQIEFSLAGFPFVRDLRHIFDRPVTPASSAGRPTGAQRMRTIDLYVNLG